MVGKLLVAPWFPVKNREYGYPQLLSSVTGSLKRTQNVRHWAQNVLACTGHAMERGDPGLGGISIWKRRMGEKTYLKPNGMKPHGMTGFYGISWSYW